MTHFGLSFTGFRSIAFAFLLLTALGLVAALIESVQASGTRSMRTPRVQANPPSASRSEYVHPDRVDAMDLRMIDARSRLGRSDPQDFHWRLHRGRLRDRVTAVRLLDGLPVLPERGIVFEYDRRGVFIGRRGTSVQTNDAGLLRSRVGNWDDRVIGERKRTAWRGRAERVWWWPSDRSAPIAAWRTFERGKAVITDAAGGGILARRPAGDFASLHAIP